MMESFGIKPPVDVPMVRVIDEKGIKERTCQMVPDPDFDILECSECGYEEEKLYVVPTKGPIEFDGNFCPNCGARVERDA